MGEVAQLLASILGKMPPWEACAVVLAIAYLLLAVRENIVCWYCAFASTAIYTALFWNVSLLMESALNVYYMAMAIYGWRQWRFGGDDHHGIAIRTLKLNQHLSIIVAIGALTIVSGVVLSRNTGAAWPFVDSFTTWASVITTVMVAWKILENWLYWLVIDTISIPLYIDRGLYLTAFLYAAYLVIAIAGYATWRRHYAEQNAAPAHA